MQMIGVIVSAGSSLLTEAGWIESAERELKLRSYDAVEVRNPATGQKTWARAPASSKKLIRNEKQIGAFWWSQNEEPLLWVESDVDWIDETTDYAEKIAQILGGKFTTDYT